MNKNSVISIIVALLIIAGGAYWYFSVGTGNEAPLSASQSQNKAQAEFQSLIVELSSVSFNTAVFSDPRFAALVDVTTPISPEVSGRSDPFASIPGVNEN